MDIPIVIVWKEVQSRLSFVQGRRLGCRHCHQPFTYLVWGELEEKSVGLPVVSSTGRMGERNERGFKYQLTRAALQARAGQARCPHCGALQPWMRRRVLGNWVCYSLSAATLVALVLPFAIACDIPDGDRYVYLLKWSLAGALLLTAVATGIGWWWSRPRPERQDARAKTDAELRELLAAHPAVAPALHAWLATAGGRTAVHTYCLAIRDEVEPTIIPAGMRTADILPDIQPFV